MLITACDLRTSICILGAQKVRETLLTLETMGINNDLQDAGAVWLLLQNQLQLQVHEGIIS